MIAEIIKCVVLWLLTTFSGLVTLAGLFMIMTSDSDNTNGLFGILFFAIFLFLTIMFALKAIKTTRQPEGGNRGGSQNRVGCDMQIFGDVRRKQLLHRNQYIQERQTLQTSKNGPYLFPEIQEQEPCFTSYSEQIDVGEEREAPKGSVLSYLDAEALCFWNKKRTDFKIPTYYSESAFGRNVKPALERLLANGYLSLGSLEQRISLKTVPDLKAILADNELKVSGTKKELVQRIIANIDFDSLENLFPVNVYCITEKGLDALEPYSIVKANEVHSLGLSYYRLMQAKEMYPEDDDNKILARLLSEDIYHSCCEQDSSKYQTTITVAARFMREIGEVQSSFEYYALSFFMWTRDMVRLGITRSTPQSYYISKNLEEIGQLCGYDEKQLISSFQDIIVRNNPFGLGSSDNIKYALQIFKESLGIK